MAVSVSFRWRRLVFQSGGGWGTLVQTGSHPPSKPPPSPPKTFDFIESLLQAFPEGSKAT